MFNLLALQSQQGPRSNIVQGSYNSEVVRQYYYIVVEDKHAYCLEGQIAYLDVPIKQYTHSCYVRQEPGAGVVQSASHVPRNYLAIAIGRQTDSNVYSFMVRLHVYTRWTSDVTPPRSVARAKLVRRGTVGRGLWEGDCGKGTVGRGLWEGDCPEWSRYIQPELRISDYHFQYEKRVRPLQREHLQMAAPQLWLGGLWGGFSPR